MACYGVIKAGAMLELAHYHRENPTTLRQDYEILPRVKGCGRYLGAGQEARPLDFSPTGATGNYGHGERCVRRAVTIRAWVAGGR